MTNLTLIYAATKDSGFNSNNTTNSGPPGYIPPPPSNSKPKSFLCSQVGFSGPTYTGPDGCATPCPTTGEDNIPKGCPTPPPSNSKPKSFLCSQVGFSGPTYTGPDGCATPCPTTGEDNIPKGCPTPPPSNSKPKSFLCSQVGFSGPTYTGPDGCATPCPTTGEDNIPKGCPTPCPTTGEDNIPKGCPTPSGTTSTTQNEQLNQRQQQPDSNCNTVFMVGCGSTNPSKTTTTTNQSPQTNTSETTNTGGTGSNSFSPNQPFTTTPNPTTNLGKGTANQLANPTAFNYQTNPATPSVDISKDPTQKINSLVTNSFGQGVPNIPVSIQVKDPAGKTAFLSTGKTDNDGKNVVSFPVKTAGTWTANVVISSSPAAGGPFSDQITWNAVSGETQSNLTSLVNLARTIVTLSDDPREQILTTVKDTTGKGVKDIALTIKLTNPDAVSKTFSRITDANGIDQFVIPVDKVGNWVATLTLIDPNGKTVPITSVAWKAIP